MCFDMEINEISYCIYFKNKNIREKTTIHTSAYILIRSIYSLYPQIFVAFDFYINFDHSFY
jgi:hypothetical protein